MANSPGQDVYGNYGSVPDSVQQNGSGAAPLSVHANAADFGGQVGEAVSNLGQTGTQVGQEAVGLATKYAQMATEAKANDDYANSYAPAAADLRNQYDQLQGQDKIHGYQGYIDGLQNLNRNFTSNAQSPYEKQLISGLIDRHISGEIDGAKRELVQSQLQFSNDASMQKVMADNNYAAQNYNNPAAVNQVMSSNDGTIAMQHIDAGFDPTNPDHAFAIQQAQNAAKGATAVGMINSAVSRGDAPAANAIRAQYGNFIPGYQQGMLDDMLDTENLRQTGANSVAALTAGQPIPQPTGAPAIHVQSVVADTAHAAGVDPNEALTLARIETSYGQNLGARGDIGQTGIPSNTVEGQAQNMITAWKGAQQQAGDALGRTAQPWEAYLCYQQGSGGGPALLKADPNAKAVDVLAPLYKDSKSAVSAIINNGGNTTMTAQDFMNFIQNKYNKNYAQARCEFPGTNTTMQATGEGPPEPGGMSVPPSGTILGQTPPDNTATPGQAIVDAHSTPVPAVQPSVTPKQALDNFNVKYPAMVNQINAMPNIAQRQAVMESLNRYKQTLEGSSNAYSSSLVNKAEQLAVDPKFTSMDQVPAELTSLLATEHPLTLNYLEQKAQQNQEKASGMIGKDQKEYGPAMFGLMRDIHANKITDVSQLLNHLPGVDGGPSDLTMAGYEKLKNEFTKDPESQADGMMKTQAFKVIKKQLSGEDDDLGMKDPKGEALYSQALPKLFKAIDDGKAQGKTMGELTDPTNPSWIGNSVSSLKRTPVQMSIDMQTAAGKAPAPPQRTVGNIVQDYLAEKDPNKKAAFRKEAIDKGFARPDDNKPEINAPVE